MVSNRKARILLAQRWNGGKVVQLKISNKRFGGFVYQSWMVFVQRYGETYEFDRRIRRSRENRPVHMGDLITAQLFKVGGL